MLWDATPEGQDGATALDAEEEVQPDHSHLLRRLYHAGASSQENASPSLRSFRSACSIKASSRYLTAQLG